MAKLVFLPTAQGVEVEAPCKILVAANRNKIKMRYGCASARCGTCGVKITQGQDNLSAIKVDERALLLRMRLPVDGSVRLACQARIQQGEVQVDLDFQEQYSPDQSLDSPGG